MKKVLIVGLGNIGIEYANTRHNIGFKILDTLAEEESLFFETVKLGTLVKFKKKGTLFFLLKPNTYMNLSGKAVKYWIDKETISLENILIITDDLNLDFGKIRIRQKGSDGGHNGLKNINVLLNTQEYARFRFGIGSQFNRGKQIDYVLGEWSLNEKENLRERLELATKVILSFGLCGIRETMNEFNGK